MNRTMLLRAVGIAVPFLVCTLAGGTVPTDARPAARTTLQLELTGIPASEALDRIARAARVQVRPLWPDERSDVGLSRETLVTIPARPMPLSAMIELVTRQCDNGAGGGATWQIAEDGVIEIGPRSRLNEHQVVRVYDVHDLLTDVPDYEDGATIDLQAALQAQPSGSVLRDPGQARDMRRRDRALRQTELLELVTATIEPDQWEQRGGPATIRFFRDHLVIQAAPYIHRQLSGHGGL